MGAIQVYVVGLLSELLGAPTETEARFPWALGDVSPRTRRAVQLPFDAYWQELNLIVEVDEDQHHRPVAHFDKPDVMTISGIHRGEQRRLYDQRKRDAARAEGYTVLEVPWPRRPPPSRRDREQDTAVLRELLREVGISITPRTGAPD
jgi:hypothetical protein